MRSADSIKESPSLAKLGRKRGESGNHDPVVVDDELENRDAYEEELFIVDES
jgi:hypothetical protein